MIREVAISALKDLTRTLMRRTLTQTLIAYRRMRKVPERSMAEFEGALRAAFEKLGFRRLRFAVGGVTDYFECELPLYRESWFKRLSYSPVRLSYCDVQEDVLLVLHSRAAWVLLCRSAAMLQPQLLLDDSDGYETEKSLERKKQLRGAHRGCAVAARLKSAPHSWRYSFMIYLPYEAGQAFTHSLNLALMAARKAL